MKHASGLKRTHIGFNHDRAMEITDARTTIWPQLKNYRDSHGKNNVQLKCPAALKINGRVVEDICPDWHEVLCGSSHTNVPNHVQQSLKYTTASVAKTYNSKCMTPGDDSDINTAISLENESSMMPVQIFPYPWMLLNWTNNGI